ncbi:hypothetical protein C8R46DRAFT_922124 [Mycena filopes]|nr:hypothetical protein C8R46DRAFT_922124 [Mycena filopes]
MQRRDPFTPLAPRLPAILTQGNGAACTRDTTCQLACCAFATGICVDPVLAQQDPSLGGCGFGNAAPNCDVALALNLTSGCVAGAVNGSLSDIIIQDAVDNFKNDELNRALAESRANATSIAGMRVYALPTGATVQRRQPFSKLPIPIVPILRQANGTACTRDDDCHEGCCAFNTGTCADPILAQQDDAGFGGCGFGDAAPNCQVAAALNSTTCVDGAVNGSLSEFLLQHAVENFQVDGVAATIHDAQGSIFSDIPIPLPASETPASPSQTPILPSVL